MSDRARPSAKAGALAALDALVLIYAAAGIVYLLAGPLDLGVASVRRFSKPFLLLLVLAAVRAAIPADSWLARAIRGSRPAGTPRSQC